MEDYERLHKERYCLSEEAFEEFEKAMELSEEPALLPRLRKLFDRRVPWTEVTDA
jgi:hypothetical protein